MSNSSTSNDPFNDSFSALTEAAMVRFKVPGISIAVIKDSKTQSRGYGFSVLPETRATPETLYYMASTTKSFTNAALSMLMDDEAKDAEAAAGSGSSGHPDAKAKLTWRTPIASIIRDDFVLTDDYATLHCTLEDAASHRSCIPRHDEAYSSDSSTRDVVHRLRHLPLMSAPLRSTMEYANTPYMALTCVVETLTQKPLETFLKQRIWDPLGMHRTRFSSADLAERGRNGTAKDLARGYFWDERGSGQYVEEPFMDLTVIGGAGATVSSVVDYAKYLTMMINQGAPLSATAHAELRKPRSIVHWSSKAVSKPSVFEGIETYALGWTVQIYRGVEVFQHGGGIHGYSTYMGYVPRHSFGAVICANAGEWSWFAEQAMFFALLDDVLGIPEAERFDFIAYGSQLGEEGDKYKYGAREKHFPSPIANIQHALPLEAYAGSFFSPGYDRVVFKVAKQTPCVPGADTARDVLRAECYDRLWPFAIELEHITGEHFMAWVLSRKGVENASGDFDVINRGVKARMVVGSDGKVSELGIAMEPALGDELIWFKREI